MTKEPHAARPHEYESWMRESHPDLCWRLSDGGKRCCILERGHDNGLHEHFVARADYSDLPWWARLIYWRSLWFRLLCTDAWSFRRNHHAA